MPVPTHIFDSSTSSAAAMPCSTSPTSTRAARSTRPPSACMSRTPTTKRYTCAAPRSTSITRWCCERRRLAACSRPASRSATTAISTRRSVPPRNGITYAFADAAVPGPHAGSCTDPLASSSNSTRRWTSAGTCCGATTSTKAAIRSGSIISTSLRRSAEHRRLHARLGFRLTDMARKTRRTGGSLRPGCTARATSTTSRSPIGRGPRLHISPIGCSTAMNVLHLCDVMASSGYLKNIERGPGRHGIRTHLPLCQGSRRPSPRTLHQRLFHRRPRP